MTISTFSVLENTIPIDSLYKKEAFQVSMEQITVHFSGVGAGWMTGAGVLPEISEVGTCLCACVHVCVCVINIDCFLLVGTQF